MISGNKSEGFYKFRTKEQGVWEIALKLDESINDFLPNISQDDYDLSLINIKVRQKELRTPKTSGESRHLRGVYFFASNWSKLVNDFIRPIGGDFESKCFIEVGLKIKSNESLQEKDYGIPDIVGVDSRGNFLIFEFGNGDKLSKIESYTQGLKGVLHPFNPVVKFYIIKFDPSLEKNSLRVYSPDVLERENKEKNDKYPL